MGFWGDVAKGSLIAAGGAITLGVIGSVVTGNPLPLMAAIHAAPAVAAKGAIVGGGVNKATGGDADSAISSILNSFNS